MSDLCANSHCSDIAAPGRDYCTSCWTEELHGREVTRLEAVRLTAENEAAVLESDEAAA